MMDKSRKSMTWLLIVGLFILTVINLYNYTTKNIARNLEIIQAGGDERYEKLQEAYNIEEYQKYQSDALEGVKKQFSDPKMKETIEQLRKTKEQNALNSLAKIKASHKFIKGEKDARFTIVEYSELICPYCKRHSQKGTLEKVMELFPGEVNVIHVPYIVHKQANNIEQAVLCARDQKDAKAYYALIKKLFTTDMSFQGKEENLEIFIEEAKKLGYNDNSIRICVESEKYAEELVEDTAYAKEKFGVTGTPGNVIIDTKNGTFYNIAGAYPVSEFEAKINEMKGKKRRN